jgi:hypothetical protein
MRFLSLTALILAGCRMKDSPVDTNTYGDTDTFPDTETPETGGQDSGEDTDPPTDADGDGYVSEADGGNDCDDTDAAVHPGAIEDCTDDIDNDCDGWVGTCALSGTLEVVDADVTIFGEEYRDRVGDFVTGLGDVTGDGIVDVGISDSDNGVNSDGVTYVIPGPITEDVLLAEAEDAIFRIDSVSGSKATQVSPLGDINGDGMRDVSVSVNWNSYGVTGNLLVEDEADGFIFLGPLSVGQSKIDEADILLFTGRPSGGYSVLAQEVGDVNGDGHADLLASDPGWREQTGRVYLLHGPISSGSIFLDTASEARIQGVNNLFELNNVEGDQTGVRMAGPADFNADGFDDLVFSSVNYPYGEGSGLVSIFYGPLSGMRNTEDADENLAGGGYLFGCDLDIAGDTNGDGYPDLVVGALSRQHTGDGSAWLFNAPIAGWKGVVGASASLLNDGPHWAGASVAGAGDVNNDGFDDLLIGSRGGGNKDNHAWLQYGPISGSMLLSQAHATFRAPNTDSEAGYDVAGVGDVNLDGIDDILIGDPVGTAGDNIGRAYLFYGR